MNYDTIIDRLIEHYTSEKYSDEVQEAKASFYKSAGIFDEESFEVEMKILQFMDWYIFNRKLKAENQTPIKKALMGDEFKFSSEEAPMLVNLGATRHSLFEFLKVKGEDIHIKDLFSGYKLVLKKSPVIVGFNKDEIFEARLIPHEDSFVFSRAFCIHPAQATKYILKEIKAINKLKDSDVDQAREDLILKLFKMRHKVDQYKHVKLTDIYCNDSKLGI